MNFVTHPVDVAPPFGTSDPFFNCAASAAGPGLLDDQRLQPRQKPGNMCDSGSYEL